MKQQGRVDVDDVVLLNEDELLTVLNNDIGTDRPGEDDEELLDARNSKNSKRQ